MGDGNLEGLLHLLEKGHNFIGLGTLKHHDTDLLISQFEVVNKTKSVHFIGFICFIKFKT